MHAVRRSHAGLRIAAACGAMLFVCGAGAAHEPQAYEIDAGFDAAPQSLYWYSEAITALKRDLAKDGFLLRVYGSLAVYQYASTVVQGTVRRDALAARPDARLPDGARRPRPSAASSASTISSRSCRRMIRRMKFVAPRLASRLKGTITIRTTSSPSRPAWSASTRRLSTRTTQSCASARASATSSSSVPMRRWTATPATTRSVSAAMPSTPSK